MDIATINNSVLEEVEDEVTTYDDVTFSTKVILFNDDWHTFDEVIFQIMKATGKSKSSAEALTVEVHEKGKAWELDGELSACLKVSSILEEIALHTQIEY